MTGDRVLPISVGVLDDQHGALAYAAGEADRIGCDLRVVHAYTVPPRPPTKLSSAYGIDIAEAFRRSGDDVLSDAVEFLGECSPGIKLHRVLERASASDLLLRQAAMSRLVVLGPDDVKPWYSRLFESRVTRRLAEDSPCPVVVVPEIWDEAPRAFGVTLMLDAETTAHGPLRYAFEAASHRGEALTVVHLVPVEGSSTSTLAWRDMMHLIGSWQALFPRVQVDTTRVAGSADLDSARALEQTGLLVLGRPHGSYIIAGMGQSLARAVIERADCPVAVVPPRYDG